MDDVFRFMPVNDEKQDLKIFIFMDKGLNVGIELTSNIKHDIDKLFDALKADCEFKKYLKAFQVLSETFIKESKARLFKGSVSQLLDEKGNAKIGSIIIYPQRAGNWLVKDEKIPEIDFLLSQYSNN